MASVELQGTDNVIEQLGKNVSKAKDTFTAVSSLLSESGVPSYFGCAIAGFISGIVLVGGVLLTAFINLGLAILQPLAIAILQIVKQIRAQGFNELNELAAEAMGEFMGVDVDPAVFKGGVGADASLRAANAIGGALHELLTKEFAPDGTVSPEQGANAAKAFSGFNIRWAVSNAFVSILCELVSDEHLQQFRELGVDVAENLGLGRLHRQALRPLVDTLITKPYTDKLNAQYRPNRLTDAQFVNAYYSGRLSPEQVRAELQRKGYADGYIDEVLAALKPRVTLTELYNLLRNGDMTQDDVIRELVAQGVPADVAALKIKAQYAADAQTRESAYVSQIIAKVSTGFMEPEAATNLLQQTSLSDKEQQWVRNTYGLKAESPRKRITFAELTKLYVASQLTLTETINWMQQEGYDEEGMTELTLLLLMAKEKAAPKKAAADHVAAVLAGLPSQLDPPAA